MNQRRYGSIAILLILTHGLACSMLQARRGLTWRITLQIESPAPDRDAAIRRTILVIEKRLDAMGIAGFEVHQDSSASDRVIVSLPNAPDHERLKRLIVAGGKLELFHIVSLPSPEPCRTFDTKEEAIAFVKSIVSPASRRVLPYSERSSSKTQQGAKWVIVDWPPVIDGTELRDAKAVRSRAGNEDEYEIVFSLKQEGAYKFGSWTGANINEYIGVALNDEVKSVAFIKGQIFDQGEITGRFTKQAAEDLALVLSSGALPAPIRVIEEQAIQ